MFKIEAFTNFIVYCTIIMVKMIADISEALIDGYYPDEITGEILVQMVEYLMSKEEIEEIIWHKKIQKTLKEEGFVLIKKL